MKEGTLGSNRGCIQDSKLLRLKIPSYGDEDKS